MTDNQEWTDDAVRWARRIAEESGRPELCVRTVNEHAGMFAVTGPIAEFNEVLSRLAAAGLTPIARGQSWPIVFVMFVRTDDLRALEEAVHTSPAMPTA